MMQHGGHALSLVLWGRDLHLEEGDGVCPSWSWRRQGARKTYYPEGYQYPACLLIKKKNEKNEKPTTTSNKSENIEKRIESIEMKGEVVRMTITTRY